MSQILLFNFYQKQSPEDVLQKKALFIKGALPGLRQFLETESPLKIMKNASNFTLKAFFVLKMSKFLPRLFVHVGKRLDKKAKDDFIIMTSLSGN